VLIDGYVNVNGHLFIMLTTVAAAAVTAGGSIIDLLKWTLISV